MDRDELLAIALRHETRMSDALLRALGVDRRTAHRGAVAAKVDRHEGARELMRQRHGVRGL